MRARLRQIGLRINASYWFIPAVLTVGAFVLSFVTYVIDVKMGSNWVSDIWWLHTSKPDGARSLVSSISGSMISVAGTVFAITIAAVVYASGNYGPRLLTNFMTDRGNQLSLGVFIATFVYSLMVLRTIRQPDEGGGIGFVPELSLLLSIVFSLLSVGVLVYFLHHVPDSIRINNVVAGVGHRALKEIEDRYPDTPSANTAIDLPKPTGTAVASKRIGYIEVIDFDALRDVTRKQGITVHLCVRSGDFVHPSVPLLLIDGDFGEGVEADLRDAFAMGDNRSSRQDIEYSIDELVEIALRALSPGINDPFTAITCFHWLGAATATLAGRDLCRDPDAKRYGEDGLFAVADDFAHFVDRGFASVRMAAAANDIASRIFLEAIQSCLTQCASPGRRALLIREADLLVAQAREALAGPALDELIARRAEFDAA